MDYKTRQLGLSVLQIFANFRNARLLGKQCNVTILRIEERRIGEKDCEKSLIEAFYSFEVTCDIYVLTQKSLENGLVYFLIVTLVLHVTSL